MYYTVEREILLGRADALVFSKGEKVSVLITIPHACDELESSDLQVIKKTRYPKYKSSDRIDFKDINYAAKQAGVLATKKLYDHAEELRTKRNTIHISSLTMSSNDYFKKEDVENIFSFTHEIIAAVESRFS